MKYLIQWLELLEDLLPPRLRKKRIRNLIWALLMPLAWIYELFLDFRDQVILEIGKNGQVIVLEKLLNDDFDNSLRRIYIEDYIAEDTSSVFLITENQVNAELYLISEIPPGQGLPLLLATELDGYLNFIVWIPLALQGTIDLIRLMAILDTYKYSGMKYVIQYF